MTPDEEYRQWVSTQNVIVFGGAPKVVCPRCADTHQICQFATGTVFCVRKDCSNPHHLPRPYADEDINSHPGEGYL